MKLMYTPCYYLSVYRIRFLCTQYRCYNSILHQYGGQLPRPFVITVDGPVASGKTTAGRELASRLGYRFLDTGVMYRAATWLALHQGIEINDLKALADIAESAVISLVDGSNDTIIIEGHELSSELRQPNIDRYLDIEIQE